MQIMDNDSWGKLLSGCATVIVGAFCYVWKKNADARLTAQMDGTAGLRELVDYLKGEITTNRRVSRSNTRAIQALKKSFDQNTQVLKSIESNQKTHLESTKELHVDMTNAIAGRYEICAVREGNQPKTQPG